MFAIDSELFENLCPIYKNNVLKLQYLLLNSYDFKTKNKCFMDFADMFTAIPDIWLEWAKLFDEYPLNTENEQQNRKLKFFEYALTHFYHEKLVLPMTSDPQNFWYKHMLWTKVLKSQKAQHFQRPKFIKNRKPYIESLKNAMFLPSNSLPFFYKYYDEYGYEPITNEMKQKYWASIKLFQELNFLENDENEWVECLQKTNDDCFVIQNIECAIGKKPWNKKLWFIYINFLEKKGFYVLKLKTMSRFCRFFLYDSEMIVSYCNEIERIRYFGIDVTKFEFDNIRLQHDFFSSTHGIIWNQYYHFTKIAAHQYNTTRKYKMRSDSCNELFDFVVTLQPFKPIPHQCKHISFCNEFKQQFSLPNPLIYYILNEADYELLQKLYFSSKSFYHINKKPICHRFEITIVEKNPSFFQQSIFMPDKNMNFKNIKNFYLTNSLDVITDTNPSIVTQLIPNIYKSEIRYLTLACQKLTMKEFEFFSETLEHLKLLWTLIETPDLVSVKDIVDRMPNGSFIALHENENNLFLSQTPFSIKTLKRNRISTFYYEGVTENIDANAFTDFVTHNASTNCSSSFNLIFKSDISENYKFNLRKDVQNILEIIDNTNVRIRFI